MGNYFKKSANRFIKRMRDIKLRNSKTLKFFPIIFLGLVAVIFFTFNYLFNTYSTVIRVENNGYMLTGNFDLESLKKSGDKIGYVLNTVKVNEYDYIYKNNLNNYLDDSKKNTVSIEYPLFINDGLSIVNYNDNVNLVDKDLDRSMGYSNFVLSYGSLYNINDYTPTTDNKYLLLSYSNGIYINLFDLKINTTANEYIIPVDSLIYFSDGEIRYLKRSGNEFIKSSIEDVDRNSTFKFYYESNEEEYSFSYDTLSKGIGTSYIEEIKVPSTPIINEEEQIEVVVNEPVVKEKKDETIKWIKPSVVVNSMSSNVYSVDGVITINDPAGVITKSPTFTFISNGKTYLRRSVTNNGEFTLTGLLPNTEFQIIGEYTYLNADLESKTIVTFYSNTIKTKDLSELDIIKLDYSLGDIYSKSIELSSLQIVSDIESETLKGVKNCGFTINGETYNISKSDLVNLLKGKVINNVNTGDNLKSNSSYDFEINFFDQLGNKLPVMNNSGKTRTSAKIPSTSLRIAKIDVDCITIGVSLKNEDNITLNNYRYGVLNTAGNVVSSGEVTGDTIELRNLDPNQLFEIFIFSDFDIDDGKGTYKNYELGSMSFTALPLSSLGYFNFNVEVSDISSDAVVINYSATNKTDTRLLNILYSLKAKLYLSDNHTLVNEYELSSDDMKVLKNHTQLSLNFGGLSSDSKYVLEFEAVVKQGETIENVECLHNLEEFETKKHSAYVSVTNSLTTSDSIDFDARIIDVDNVIESENVRIEFRDYKNNLVEIKTIGINGNDERITFNYLETDKDYTILFIADGYNETNSSTTYEFKHELLKLSLHTDEGISGKIELVSSIREANGINLVDIYSDVKWSQNIRGNTIPKTIDEEGHMHIYGKNGMAGYAYDLSDYHDKYVTVSFKIKAINKLPDSYGVYFGNYYGGKNDPNYSILLDNISTEEWTSYNYSFIVGSVKNNRNQYNYCSTTYGKNNCDWATFFISNATQELAEYEIKDFEIHIAGDREEVDMSDYSFERGYFTDIGNKASHTKYARLSKPIIAEAGSIYTFDISGGGENDNYEATIYYTDMNNNRLDMSQWNVKHKGFYAKEDTKVYILFLNNRGNDVANLSEVNFSVHKYKFRDQVDYSDYSSNLVTNVKVDLLDRRDEVSNNTYYIKVTNKDTNEEKVLEYMELIDTNIIDGVIKTLDLNENSNYNIELYVTVRDRKYILDSFDISTNKEVKGISTRNDFYFVQANGNYILLNDLDLSDFTNKNIDGYREFNGVFDFQGYTITLNSKKGGTAKFGSIGTNGVFKNLVLDYHLDNDTNNNSMQGFVTTNKGLIENVKITVTDERETRFNDKSITFLVNTNAVTGKIRNFNVKLNNKLNLYSGSALVAITNNGLVENGYVYGENVYVTNEESNVTYRSVSLVQVVGGPKSILQNVYTLPSIEFPNNYYYDISGLIARNTSGIIQNVYTVGETSNLNQAVGPILSSYSANTKLKNVYYKSKYTYTADNQTKISNIDINNVEFQKSTLKSGFNIEDMIKFGYYPQVIYTSNKMPKQEYLPLPEYSNDNIEIVSMNVREKTNNSAIIDIVVDNPDGSEISDVVISDLTTKINSQRYQDGKSFVEIQVSDPSVFQSKYAIRSISSKSYTGIISKKQYNIGDKYLYVDFYREINNVNDWINIKNNVKENYIIMEDLDFREYNNYFLSITFSGAINGNGHTLKNINLVNKNLITNMYGTLENINFENVNIKFSTANLAGIIGSSKAGKFSNVSIKNAILELSGSPVIDMYYAGVLVASSNSTTIVDCSIVDSKIISTLTSVRAAIGGFAGSSSANYISNVFAQNIDISVTGIIASDGVGGIIGYQSSSNDLLSYAYTSGNISSSADSVGGIIGREYGFVDHCYSSVNVISSIGNVGGIVGLAHNKNNITNNIFVGTLYSKSDKEINGKIIGSNDSPSSNYALDSVLINGNKTTISNGETIITRDKLLNTDIYIELGFNVGFDLSHVSDGIMPKLYHSEVDKLLDNQVDILLPGDLFEVNKVLVSKHTYDGTVSLQLKNPDNYIIDSVLVEGMDANITKNYIVNGVSVVEFDVTPTKYYDSYRLSKIRYKVDNSSEILDYNVSIKLDMRFYKELKSYEDWQEISTIDAENYYLANDIDFTGKDVKTGVVFNRLDGDKDNPHTISGIHINYNNSSLPHYNSLISRVVISVANVNFDDISIINKKNCGRSYMGIFAATFGVMENVSFTNINIKLPGSNKVSLIALCYNDSIKNITLDNINISGGETVGGFIAVFHPNDIFRTVDSINASNITINATSARSAGVIAWLANSFSGEIKPITNITLKDSNITGTEYVGGIVGYGVASDSTVTNTHVTGNTSVGGAFGFGNNYYSTNVVVLNSEITGAANYIGGLAGRNVILYDSLVKDSTITGSSIDSNSVGGIMGSSSANLYRSVLENSTITNNGTDTGGIVGQKTSGTIAYDSVSGSTITGRINTGGVVGNLVSNAVDSCRVIESNITSTQSYAGGVVGYMQNINNEVAVTSHRTNNIFVGKTNIISKAYAGGFIGGKNAKLAYPESSCNLYFDGTVVSEDTNTAGLGSGDSSNLEMINLGRTGFYENSTVNGVKAKDMVSEVYEQNLITETYAGYLDGNGEPTVNYNYPDATYTNLIKLEAGETYRVRGIAKNYNLWNISIAIAYDLDGNYISASLEYDAFRKYFGVALKSYMKDEYYLTPLRDCYIRIKYERPVINNDVMKIKSTDTNLFSNRLLSADELRAEHLWYSTSYGGKFNYSRTYFDFSVLNSNESNYSFEDKSGNNNTAYGDISALAKNGAYFDGEDDYIKLDNYTLPDNFSVSINYSTYKNRLYQYLFSYRDEETNNFFGIYIHDNRMNVIVNSSSYSTNHVLSCYRKYNIVVTIQNHKTLKLYENGKLITTKTLPASYATTGNISKGTYTTYIGHDTVYSTNINKFEGYITNIAVFDRIMTQDEITANYSSAGYTNMDGINLYYDFANMKHTNKGYYPLLKYALQTRAYEAQSLVELPTGEENLVGTSLMMSSRKLGSRKLSNQVISNNYHVYSSGINTINLEFDDLNSNMYFTYKSGDVNERVKVDKRVYSIYYDYNSDIEIILESAIDSKKITLTKDDIAKTIAISDDNYYYIKNNSLYNKDNLLINDVVHIYNNLALTTDGRVYNLDTNKYQVVDVSKNILSNSIPLYHNVINGKEVDTYYNFSIISQDGNEVLRDEQVILKDKIMHVYTPLSTNDNSKVLVNTYNGREYQIALGSDNKLYSYKEEIKFDGTFINDSISDINYDFNSNSPIVIIKYLSGKVLVFNYSNGVILYQEGENNDVSLFTYLGMSLRSNRTTVNNTSYLTSMKFTSTLSNITDKEVLDLLKGIDTSDNSNNDTSNNDNSNNSSNIDNESIEEDLSNKEIIDTEVVNDYITTYNPDTNSYESYSTNDILNTNKEEVETISYKIKNNEFLNNYFDSNKSNELFKNNRVLIYVGIFILIISNLIYLKLRTKKGV